MAKYYKCLRLNPLRASWYNKSFIWPATCPVSVRGAEPNGPCGRGLHLAKSVDDAFIYGRFPAIVYEAEPLSPILGEDCTKIRVAKARLVKRLQDPWIDEVNKFLARITRVKWFANHKPPLKSWRVFDTRKAAWYAMRKVGWNAKVLAAWDVAVLVAWDAARNGARNAAASAAEAARDMALMESWRAVQDDKWDAAQDSVDAAVYDAELAAELRVCVGLPVDRKHAEHAKARWEVWERGYGLLCDIDGEFYVYKKP